MADVAIVTTAGLTLITTALVALAAIAPKWAQWGVGTTPPVVGNTDLETKTGCNEARVNDDYAVATTTLTDDSVVAGALITKATAGAAITEVGLFNAYDETEPPTGDTMFMRATFDAINLVVGNSIDFTITVKFDPDIL